MAANGNKTNGATPFHPRMLINGEVSLGTHVVYLGGQ